MEELVQVNQGRVVTSPCSIWSLASVVVYSLLCYSASVIIIHVFTSSVEEMDYKLENVLFAIITVLFMVLHFYAPFQLFLETPMIISYVNKWKNFEEQLQNVTGEQCDGSLEGWAKLAAWLGIPTTILFMGLDFLTYVSSSTIIQFHIIIIFSTIFLSNYLCFIFYIFTCIYAARNAKTIRKHLEKVLALKMDTTAKLSKVRLLWVALSDLTQDIGNVMPYTLMLIMMTASANAIISSYSIIISLTQQRLPPSFLGFFFFFGVSASSLFLFSDTADRVADMVGLNVSKSLFKVNISSLNSTSRQQVSHFIQALNVNYPKIDLGGFCTIDKKFWVSFLSTTVTYLVVLGQFKASEK